MSRFFREKRGCQLRLLRLVAGPLMILALSACGGEAAADVVAAESFDYAPAVTAAGQNGGSGWAAAWSGPTSGNSVHGGDSAFPGSPLFGGHVRLNGQTRIERPIDVSESSPAVRVGLVENGVIGKPGTTVYLGFLQRISTVPSARSSDAAYLRYYAFELKRTGDDTGRVLIIGHDDRSEPKPNHGYGAASVTNNRRDDKEPGQFASLGEEDDRTNQVVVKICFGAEGNDIVEIYRNPEPKTSESEATVDARLEGDFRFDRIALARFVGKAPVHAVDEIRVATSFAEAIAVLDSKSVERFLAAARRERDKAAETLRQRLAGFAENGRDVRPWLARIDAALATDQKPWEQAAAIETIGQSLGLLDVPLPCDKLLMVKRHMFQPSHIYTEYSDGPYRPGGELCVLSPLRPDGSTTTIFEAGEGIIRDPELSYDARRVLFSYRPKETEGYHIYEIGIDGSGLRQLTDGPYDDLDPLYLPDGRIAFTSTRCMSRVLCFWPQSATLFVMQPDGTGIRRLSANNVNEFTPDMLPDGRILYTRWEYMDKSAIYIQSLWSTNPDGTRAQQLFGNYLIHPVSLLQARLIPGTRKFACVLAAHNGDSVGPLAVVDPTVGMNDPDAILNLVPECNYHAGCFAPHPIDENWTLVSYGPTEPFGVYAFELTPPVESIRPRQMDVPLNATQHPGNLRDYWPSAVGERHLVYRDPVYSCVEAIPIVPRPRPPIVASALPDNASPMDDEKAQQVSPLLQAKEDQGPRTGERSCDSCGASSQRAAGQAGSGTQGPAAEAEPSQAMGTLLLADVYRGLGGVVPRGTIKYLRIVEEMGDLNHPRGGGISGFMNHYAAPWESRKPAPSLQVKQVHGIVPVEPDGSACFRVPPNRPLYFQTLDADFNEIQRMRSYIYIQPGEQQSCIGCHESRWTAPPKTLGQLAALGREPSTIEPPPWGGGPFAYKKLVQPIWDRKCVSCHGPDEAAGGLDLASLDAGRSVPRSFFSLVRPRTDPERPPLVDFFDSWWGVSWTVPVAEPMQFGVHKSRLVEVIDDRHEGIAMSDEQRAALVLTPAERRIVTTWIDLNCPLWDNYRKDRHLPQTVSR